MKKTILILTILCGANTSLAFEKEETHFDLKRALSESNKDYNNSKRVSLKQENQRIIDWSQRDQDEIVITADISVEMKSTEAAE